MDRALRQWERIAGAGGIEPHTGREWLGQAIDSPEFRYGSFPPYRPQPGAAATTEFAGPHRRRASRDPANQESEYQAPRPVPCRAR